MDVECADQRRSYYRICCHDSRRIIPWTLFSSFVTLTVVLLVLFLVFKDDRHLQGKESSVIEGNLPSNLSASNMCGYRADTASHPGIDTRVSGGRATTIEAWPWMVSLRNEYGTHFCGATLISSQWVLTAAHCLSPITSPNPLGSIVLGDTSLTEPSEYHVTRENFSLHVHPDFDSSTFAHDIALIYFDPPVSRTKGVSAACLNQRSNELDVFSKCFVAGWGSTSYSDIRSDILQEGRLPLVPRPNCSAAYTGRHLVTSDMICAVSSDWQVDTCKGDSGGPLVCESSSGGTWSLVGVTSYGYGCWNPGDPAPGVYSRVSSYFTDFIKGIVDTNIKR